MSLPPLRRGRATAAAIVLLGAAAAAQEPVKPADAVRDAKTDAAIEDAETVLITATRTKKSRLATPAQAFQISSQRALQEDLSKQWVDALRWQPGVTVQKTSSGQASPYLRGLTGYHTLLMVDGVRLNDSVLRSGPNDLWSTVDPFSVGSTELVLGPSSVLYGSDAVGGTANVSPKSRKDYSKESDWDRRVIARGATGEHGLLFRFENEGNVGRDFGFFVGGTYQPNGRIDAGGDRGPQPNTGYENLGADAVFDFRFDEHWSLRVMGQTFDLSDAWRTHATSSGVTFAGTAAGTDQRRVLDFRRDLAAITLSAEEMSGFVDSARFQLSYQGYDEREDRVTSSGSRTWQGFDVATLGFSAQFTSKTELGTFTYGVEWYRDDVDSFRENYNSSGVLTSTSVQGPVGDDASYDLVGAFVQDDVRLGERFDLLLGARFTYAAVEADRVALDGASSTTLGAPVDDDWTNVVGSAKLVFRATDEVSVYGGAAQGFRAPNLSDLTRLDIARSGELEQPQRGLDHESFWTFELGAKTETKGGFSADAAFFYTILDDVIIRQPTTTTVGSNTVVVKSNDGDGHVQGVDAGLGYRFDENWSARGTFTWQDGQLDQYATTAPVLTTEPLSRMAPLQGSVAVRWQTADGKFWVEPRVMGVTRADRLNSGDRRDTQRIPPNGTPGYGIFSIRAGAKLCESATLFGGVDNVFDKEYRVHGSGQQEPGLNAILGVEITF
jgi:hemoglobin/transferrin/lactoferrin receptor protein